MLSAYDGDVILRGHLEYGVPEAFILEGDWTPTKTKLSQLTTYRGGSLIFFQDEQSEKITVLQMEEYDSQTGTYTVTFPGIGPYMVVQERLN